MTEQRRLESHAWHADTSPQEPRDTMKLLRKLACLLIGHVPIVERRGDDSVLACERCQHLFELFVKDVYKGK
jgi:hypothetical protein